MRTRSSTLASLLLALLSVANLAVAQVAGETRRTTVQPSAAVRDAQHRTELRITIWYPAAASSVAHTLVIGPPQEPLFSVGSVAPDAPFAADRIPGERLTMLPRAGHYTFLAMCTAAGVATVPVCAHPGPQEKVHRVAIEQAKELFGRYLGSRKE